MFNNVFLIVIFAMQHEKPELMDLGLQSMHAMTVILRDFPQLATDFYKFMYSQILRETLAVMIDYRHVSGFKMQAMILHELLTAVDDDKIINPLSKLHTDQNQPHTSNSNKEFVCEYLSTNLLSQFRNMNKVQVEAFVIKLFNSINEWKTFKDTLRDLLISMKSYASQNDEFYAEEMQVSILVFFLTFLQAALEKQKHIELENKKAIPGMIAPGSAEFQLAQQQPANGFGFGQTHQTMIGFGRGHP